MHLYTLIAVFPLLAAICLAVAGRWIGERSHKLGIPAVGMSFGLSVAAFVEVFHNGPQSIPLYRLLQSGNLAIDLGFYIDQLTVLLLLLVTGVGVIVHIYSSRYMIGDPRYSRFFALIGFFTSAMVMLVMSRNLLMMYMCWEVMGICSYLLISHWAQRQAAAKAATKAFLVNSVADVGLGLGVIVTFYTFGTLDIPEILERATTIRGQTTNLLGWASLEFPVQTTTLIMLLLFTGAMGKSAQFPLHVWLPFAMEAPTPVSALIHAATMVNAGPFLLVRFSPLLMLSPAAMSVIAVVGATTALFAAFVSLTQTDIKRILAYSTISQIGFMIMTCGLGAFVAAIFHLVAHGFLKGFLFLSTGNALQAVADHHRHSAASLHDSRAPVPGTSLIAALILSCIAPLILFAGPYEAMWTVHQTPAARLAFWIIGLGTVFFTSMYLFRGIVSFFPESLTVAGSTVWPQVFSLPHGFTVLTGAAVLYGALFGFSTWFAAFLLPPSSTVPSAAPISLRFLWPLLAALAGWGFAYALHVTPRPVAFVDTGPAKWLYMLFWNKLYIDEIYNALFVNGLVRCGATLLSRFDARIVDGSVNGVGWLTRFTSTALSRFDARIVDGGVNGAAWLTRFTSTVSMWWDTSIIDGAVRRVSFLVELASYRVRMLQTGQVQRYALLAVMGAFLILGWYLWR
jgi:NADH-quinone oxidoreductase subunit L